MWTAFFILAYGAAHLISSKLPSGHDWSGYFSSLRDSVAWLKANDQLFPVGLALTEIGLALTWASLEVSLLVISFVVRIKSYAIRAFTFK